MQTPDFITRRERAARAVRIPVLIALLLAPRTLAGQQDTLHGIVVADPYRHLERDSRATQEWVRAQDRRSRARFQRAPDRERIREGILRIAARPVILPPLRRGASEFFGVRSHSGPDATNDVMVRPRGSAGPGRAALTGGAGRGRRFFPSPDGRLLAYTVQLDGSLRSAINVIDVGTGLKAHDAVVQVHRTQEGLVWAPDGSGFFYQHTPVSGTGGGAVAPSMVRFHRLRPAAEESVFTPPADAGPSTVRIGLHPGATVLTILLTDNATSHDRIFLADAARPGAAAREVTSPTGSYAYAGEVNGAVYFHTTAGAGRGAVVRLDDALGQPRWRTVVSETDEVINTWPGVGANVLGGRLLVAYGSSAARLRPRIYDADGRFEREVTLPVRGSVWSGFVGSAQSDTAFFQVSSLADPGSVHQLIVSTGQSSPVTFGDAMAGTPDLVTEHAEVIAADGARIPVDLVYRRDTPRDGSAALVLYGYGFGGWVPAPYFHPGMAQWVLDGGIWAVTAPRGDGVHGEEWRWAGAKRNKQVGIDDYVTVSRWLSREKYTSPDRLVANGSSAGGPLVGAAVLQAPEAFGAAILDYPVLDMVRYEQFGYAGQWRSDFGTASDAGDFAVLHRVSPYHRALAGSCHPPILVAPGELDQTAPPHHAYKYVAALQEQTPAHCRSAPAYLRVSWGAGHNAGPTVSDQVETFSDQLAFLSQVLPKARRRPVTALPPAPSSPRSSVPSRSRLRP
jgi:prolyl oligopeptidase